MSQPPSPPPPAPLGLEMEFDTSPMACMYMALLSASHKGDKQAFDAILAQMQAEREKEPPARMPAESDTDES